MWPALIGIPSYGEQKNILQAEAKRKEGHMRKKKNDIPCDKDIRKDVYSTFFQEGFYEEFFDLSLTSQTLRFQFTNEEYGLEGEISISYEIHMHKT